MRCRFVLGAGCRWNGAVQFYEVFGVLGVDREGTGDAEQHGQVYDANGARPFDTTLIRGAITGMIGGAVMAMFAMTASVTYQHHGFFTRRRSVC